MLSKTIFLFSLLYYSLFVLTEKFSQFFLLLDVIVWQIKKKKEDIIKLMKKILKEPEMKVFNNHYND